MNNVIVPGTKVMRVKAGFDAYEKQMIYPSSWNMLRNCDGELVRAIPHEDGTFEQECTEYVRGRYVKERVIFVIDSYNVGFSIPSRFLEEVPLV